jgi:hypothetical protein
VLDLVAAGLLLAAPTDVAFTFSDPRITESSGLATSPHGELVYTHNDSGDQGRLFAVGLDGRTRTAWTVPGTEPRDWEDLARGPDEQGRSSLWIGDIGDNSAARDDGVLVHRIPEPEPNQQDEAATAPPTSFRLRYPNGPRDAETLLVHPDTGRLYVVTKPFAGAAEVFAAPAVLDPNGPNALERVAEARVRSTGTPGGPGIGGLANLLVTAGDIAPDGSHVALRTYTDVYEWAIPDGDLAAAFEGDPTVTELPPREQGEGLAYTSDGRSVLLSTEGSGSPVDRVVLPEPAPDEPPEEGEQAQEERTAPATPLGPVLGVAAAAVVLGALLQLRGRGRRSR